MVICKFYQQGYCRYGNQCRYEHVEPRGYTGYPGPRSQGPRNAPGQYPGRYPGPNQYRGQGYERFHFVSPQQNRQFIERAARQQYQPPPPHYHQNQPHHQPHHQAPRPASFSFTQKLREIEQPPKPPTAGFSFNRTLQQIQPQAFQQMPMMVSMPMASPFYRPQVTQMMSPMGQGMGPSFGVQFGNKHPGAQSYYDGSGFTHTAPSSSAIPPDFDSGIYSSMSSLSLDEVEQFKAEKFEFKRIPVNPPPKELCF